MAHLMLLCQPWNGYECEEPMVSTRLCCSAGVCYTSHDFTGVEAWRGMAACWRQKSASPEHEVGGEMSEDLSRCSDLQVSAVGRRPRLPLRSSVVGGEQILVTASGV